MLQYCKKNQHGTERTSKEFLNKEMVILLDFPLKI